MAIVDDLFLEGFAFPCILIFADGTYLLSGGALFPAPPGTKEAKQINFYRHVSDGWYTCPLGYAVYSFIIVHERNERLVVFGLKVKEVSSVQGKSERLSIKTTRLDVERLAQSTVNSIRAAEDRFQSIVSSGVHEFRNVNKDLYNTAYSLEQQLEQAGTLSADLLEKAKSVVQLSEMMKSRSDIFDVITNPSIAQIQDQDIHVYKAFDRARKSIISASSSRKVRLSISGTSTSRVSAVQMFDVVPYIILQNSLKYSPDFYEISIVVKEDDEYIYASVSSYGPALEPEELSKIFNPGFRGALAQRFESQGSGMGLFVVKRLIDFCRGAKIEFRQGDSALTLQGIQFRLTTVNLTLSKSKS